MPEIKVTDFTSYNFSEREQLEGCIFNELQLANLRTLLAAYAVERATLTVEHELPNAERAFVLANQKLFGNIETLKYLLACHDSAVEALSPNKEPN